MGAAHAAHCPLTHSAPAAQVLPQSPQFAGSLDRSKHPVPQSTSPGPHVQTPLLQLPPGPQLTPQAPQFCPSVDRSKHPSPQST